MDFKPHLLPALASLIPAAGMAQQAERPNIVLILADDMGYSDIGCYGGEIATPNIDRLAHEGLRYRQFYNGARSCPTRASLLTGLYAHQAGIGWMTHADMGRPAYQGFLNSECATLGDVLRGAGYGTYISGKWHVSSVRQNKGGVVDNWPNQRGFDEFFGIVDGSSDYFHPTLNRNNRQYEQKDSDFYLTDALSDSACAFINRHDFEHKPLFLYMAYNAPHWPLHALRKDIDKYVDRYRRGWDVLREERFERQKRMGLFGRSTQMAPRDADVPAWASLSKDEQEDFAMRMAIYAAQVDEMDQGIGRIVEALRQRGQLDNTLIMFLSDNGACAEHIGNQRHIDGSEAYWESYRRSWANLSSTPYKEFKHYTYEGGIATPMVVHYPRGIKRRLWGSMVDEYGHITDIMTTFVELSGATYPTTFEGHAVRPMEGVSLVPHFKGKSVGRRQTFWEHEANIAARDGRWKMVARTELGVPFREDSIRLYDMKKDPAELHDLSQRHPERTARMYKAWTAWAERVGALPLDTRQYNRRGLDYNRAKPNGEFDENFGGWDCIANGGAELSFEIDSINTLSGAKTAKITVNKSGQLPRNGALRWRFRAEKGERLALSFMARSSERTEIKFRLEDPSHINEKAIDKSIMLSTEPQEYRFTTHPLPRGGEYHLVFYVGQARGEIWVDGVNVNGNANAN